MSEHVGEFLSVSAFTERQFLSKSEERQADLRKELQELYDERRKYWWRSVYFAFGGFLPAALAQRLGFTELCLVILGAVVLNLLHAYVLYFIEMTSAAGQVRSRYLVKMLADMDQRLFYLGSQRRANEKDRG